MGVGVAFVSLTKTRMALTAGKSAVLICITFIVLLQVQQPGDRQAGEGAHRRAVAPVLWDWTDPTDGLE